MLRASVVSSSSNGWGPTLEQRINEQFQKLKMSREKLVCLKCWGVDHDKQAAIIIFEEK
jgi:hypothetical protein